MTSLTKNATTTRYTYDHLGQRLEKARGTGTTTYVGGGYEVAPTGVTKYIYAGGELVATIGGSGATTTTAYIHRDHLSSTNVTTNQSGGVSTVLDYYPYGSPRIESGTPPQRQYIGQYDDSESDLAYLNARYYDSSRGQFTSKDPVFWSEKQNLPNPQSLNSYSYAEGNPIAWKDPSGLATNKNKQENQREIDRIRRETIGLMKQMVDTIIREFSSSIASGAIDPIGGYNTATNKSKSSAQRTGAGIGTAVGAGTLLVPYFGEARGIQLSARAKQINAVLDPIAQSRRTTAILRTSSGDIVASGGRDLTRAQIQSLALGERAATAMPGAHAEVTAISEALTSQSTPQMIAASRPICSNCQSFIESTGGTIVDAFTAIWK